MRPLFALPLLLAASSCGRPTTARAPAPAALVVTGGTIYTLDVAHPRAAIAVAEAGRFTCVGARAEDCAVPTGAEVADLHGGSAVPGLADAHGHVLGLGRSLRQVDLGGCATEDECVARLAARAKTASPNEWVLGRGWDQTRWPGARFPTASALTRAVPDHPVFARRVDGHAVWLNAAALSLAHIDAKTPDPPGGRIERDASGAPSGVLVDRAIELVAAVLPSPTKDDIRSALVEAMRALVAAGLTSVHDAGVDRQTMDVYADLAAHDELPLRIYAMLDGSAPLGDLEAQMARWRGSPVVGRLTVRAVKMYADGALGSRGALLKEPYADDPGNTGLAVTPPAELHDRIVAVARAGFQPVVHAIGDRACANVLADFAEVTAAAPDLRPRVEHLQILDPSDVPLLVRSRAVASMQPTHATSDGPWAESRLGHATPRQKGAYAWRTVLDAHVPLACGSDFPVEGIDPRRGLYSAEARTWPGGPPEGWMPEQRMTRDEALRCFSQGAAYAEHAESHRGTIAAGFDADMTVFGADVMAIPLSAIREIQVKATIVAGRVEYARP